MEITLDYIRDGLRQCQYLTVPKVETAVYLALVLEKPLLVEGPAGVGKTEIAKVLAELPQTDLIRLQCYEGLDESRALIRVELSETAASDSNRYCAGSWLGGRLGTYFFSGLSA